jgi:5S rRNA maturation endonuclease (ribonuclease M5)
MTERKPGYIEVDPLQRELAARGDVVESVAAFYGRQLPELHHSGNETRMACPFDCGKTEATGDRAVSVKTEADGALFRCFQYGCTVRGNLLSLMYWMKHGQAPTGERLQGAEFREIAGDLQALVRGEQGPTMEKDTATSPKESEQSPTEPMANVPLKDSENERARALADLDEKFVTDVAAMNPKAAAYVRQRPYLTAEMMQQCRCGYLPNDAGSLLRGHFVYGWPDMDGNILTWFGRNLNYEEQHAKWKRAGDSKNEPTKFKFVKGFHRGLELYGQHDLSDESVQQQIEELGMLLVVEGPNDRVALHTLGVRNALAVCSNTITEPQAAKLAEVVASVRGAAVGVMFDLDAEGVRGRDQAVLQLAKHCPVRDAWTGELASGQFKGRQPESVTLEEWKTAIRPALRDVF